MNMHHAMHTDHALTHRLPRLQFARWARAIVVALSVGVVAAPGWATEMRAGASFTSNDNANIPAASAAPKASHALSISATSSTSDTPGMREMSDMPGMSHMAGGSMSADMTHTAQVTTMHGMTHHAVASTASAAFDSKGRLWVLTSHDGFLWVRYSDDLGKTLTDERKVNEAGEKLYADGDNRPKILPGKGDQLYITYTQVIGTSWAGNIRLIESKDRGRTFSAPVTVNDNLDPISHRFDASIVAPDGSLWIAWLDKRDQAAVTSSGGQYDGAALYYIRYGDNGTRAVADSKVMDNACECCRIAISVDTDGTPVVFWRQIYGDNIREHAIARLDAHAVAIRATHDNWHIEACPHHGPSLSISDTGTYHMVWYTGAPGAEGLYYRYTTDRGHTFSTPIRFGDNAAQAGHPYVASSGHCVVIVWKEFAGDASRVQMITSSDDGRHWTSPTTLASTQGGSDFPLLLSRRGEIYLSWLTQNEGYRLTAIEPPAQAAVANPNVASEIGTDGAAGDERAAGTARTARPAGAAGTIEAKGASETSVAATRSAAESKAVAASKSASALPHPAPHIAVSLRPLTTKTLPSLTKRADARPTLIAFWSLDCMYCKEDMSVLAAFARAHHDVRLSIVSTDTEDNTDAVKAALASYAVDGYENWIFADAVPERLRSAFDPAWHGELPRTYFYVNGERRQATSGRMSEAMLDRWYASAKDGANDGH